MEHEGLTRKELAEILREEAKDWEDGPFSQTAMLLQELADRLSRPTPAGSLCSRCGGSDPTCYICGKPAPAEPVPEPVLTGWRAKAQVREWEGQNRWLVCVQPPTSGLYLQGGQWVSWNSNTHKFFPTRAAAVAALNAAKPPPGVAEDRPATDNFNTRPHSVVVKVEPPASEGVKPATFDTCPDCKGYGILGAGEKVGEDCERCKGTGYAGGKHPPTKAPRLGGRETPRLDSERTRMTTPLPALIATIRKLSKDKGVVVVDEALGRQDHERGMWYYGREYRDEITDDAAARIALGCMAVWLSERGVGVYDTIRGWRMRACKGSLAFVEQSPLNTADSTLAAYAEAVIRVLDGMPDVATKEAK